MSDLAVTALRRFYPSSWVDAVRTQVAPVNKQGDVTDIAEIQIIRVCDLWEMELGVEYYMGHTPMARAKETYLRRFEEDERFETITVTNLEACIFKVKTYQMQSGGRHILNERTCCLQI